MKVKKEFELNEEINNLIEYLAKRAKETEIKDSDLIALLEITKISILTLSASLT